MIFQAANPKGVGTPGLSKGKSETFVWALRNEMIFSEKSPCRYLDPGDWIAVSGFLVHSLRNTIYSRWVSALIYALMFIDKHHI
jgi:hypothetical protein